MLRLRWVKRYHANPPAHRKRVGYRLYLQYEDAICGVWHDVPVVQDKASQDEAKRLAELARTPKDTQGLAQANYVQL